MDQHAFVPSGCSEHRKKAPAFSLDERDDEEEMEEDNENRLNEFRGELRG